MLLIGFMCNSDSTEKLWQVIKNIVEPQENRYGF